MYNIYMLWLMRSILWCFIYIFMYLGIYTHESSLNSPWLWKYGSRLIVWKKFKLIYKEKLRLYTNVTIGIRQLPIMKGRWEDHKLQRHFDNKLGDAARILVLGLLSVQRWLNIGKRQWNLSDNNVSPRNSVVSLRLLSKNGLVTFNQCWPFGLICNYYSS